jgi:hypothetical protein
MILNAFVPHFAATILQKRYAPGLLTGLLLLVPINAIILEQALSAKILTWSELGISTIVVGGILLALLPLLFRIGKIVI